MIEHLPYYPIENIRFASDNDLEIPTLDITKQAPGIIGGWRLWGKQARKREYYGDTFAFYGHDTSFSALIKHPEGIPKSKCAVIVEPNFSTNDRMPIWEGLWAIGMKRKLATYAQAHDILVIADLTVATKFRDANFVGIPKGWKAYCCRAIREWGTPYLEESYDMAVTHAGTSHITFIVYGGGKATTKFVQEHHWIHLPEYMRTIPNGK